jgi:hypothetical protein
MAKQVMSILTCLLNAKHLGTTVPNAMPKKSAAQAFPNAEMLFMLRNFADIPLCSFHANTV